MTKVLVELGFGDVVQNVLVVVALVTEDVVQNVLVVQKVNVV